MSTKGSLRALAALAWLCAAPAAALAFDRPAVAVDYAQALIEQARAAGLAESRQWHALMHYRPNLLRPGVKGQADDPGFYLSPQGKTRPQAELEATLRAFFAPPVEETDTLQHPQCRFVARYAWLREALDFDAARLPPQPCERFREWRETLQASELTLVFPSAFINNPSSMFGHTLLRVDGAGQDERTRLLAYAINYAVTPGSDGDVMFILKSLTGFYPGLFSISPYYAKVKDYSDLENRDIWEYRLDFTQEEIDRLLMHAWELASTRFDYYFFDENCAYHLLSLFEVARPELDLTSRFRGWVIPIDTVRLLASEPGMLKEAVYRPASNTRLRHRLGAMTAGEQALVRRLVAGEAASEVLSSALPEEAQALVLEGAYALLRHEVNRGRQPPGEAARRSRDLLVERSRLPALPVPVEPAPPAVRPDQGHATRRAAVGIGRDDGADFLSLALRPAYNDLLDPAGGYTEGAQINFLDVGVRHYDDDRRGGGRTQLERLALIDVVSLTPRDAFFRPVSWRLGTGFARKRTGEGRALVWRNNAGAGLAWGDWDSVVAYGLAEATLDVSRRLEHDYAIGAGPHVGLFVRPHPRWKVNVYGRLQEFRLGDRHREREYSLDQGISFGVQHSLRLGLSERREYGRTSTLASVAWHWYF